MFHSPCERLKLNISSAESQTERCITQDSHAVIIKWKGVRERTEKRTERGPLTEIMGDTLRHRSTQGMIVVWTDMKCHVQGKDREGNICSSADCRNREDDREREISHTACKHMQEVTPPSHSSPSIVKASPSVMKSARERIRNPSPSLVSRTATGRAPAHSARLSHTFGHTCPLHMAPARHPTGCHLLKTASLRMMKRLKRYNLTHCISIISRMSATLSSSYS